MANLPPITIKQFSGISKGLRKLLPMDCILADVGNGPKLVGFVDHTPKLINGGLVPPMIRFVRCFDDETRQAIRDKVAELRKEAGAYEVHPRTSAPPDPRIIKGHLKGEKYRSRPTTIVMPDGEPAGEVQEINEGWEEDE